eukprot:gene6773-6990_t
MTPLQLAVVAYSSAVLRPAPHGPREPCVLVKALWRRALEQDPRGSLAAFALPEVGMLLQSAAAVEKQQQRPQLPYHLNHNTLTTPSVDEIAAAAAQRVLAAPAGELTSRTAVTLLQALTKLDSLSLRDLSNVVSGYAAAAVPAPELFDGISSALQRREILEFGGSWAMARVLSAYATAGHTDEPLFAAVADALMPRLPQLPPRVLARFAWAMAASGFHDGELLCVALSDIQQLCPEQLANMMFVAALAHSAGGGSSSSSSSKGGQHRALNVFSSSSGCSYSLASRGGFLEPEVRGSGDGLLRLVAANEKLCSAKLHESLLQLLQQRSYLVEDFKQLLLKCCAVPDQKRAPGNKVPPRYAAAWSRGWLYLQAGNTVQALRDAQTAMAYSATAAADIWVPALLLAGECFAASEMWPQAVLHLAKALTHAPDSMSVKSTAAVASCLSQAVCQLTPEQAWAFKSGGLQRLHQQLQEEAEMKLPEVLRPRPKWYYYNKWMTQRIHAALLELHLPAAAAKASLSLTGSSGSSGSGDEDGTAALFSLPPAGDPQRLLTAADALWGPSAEVVLAAAATAAGLEVDRHQGNDCSQPPSAMSELHHQQQLYKLPRPVLEKLLSLDAGDLDLMIQHPSALQAQVYELLDVWGAAGSDGLEQLEVAPLSWQEVQALTGPQRLAISCSKPDEGTRY